LNANHGSASSEPVERSSGGNVVPQTIAETPQRTRIELEHRHLDRHGQGWEGVRDGISGDGGWPTYLTRYADVVAAGV
jgi:hypothetical protein